MNNESIKHAAINGPRVTPPSHGSSPQPAGEAELLEALLKFLQTAKKSTRPDVVAAARRWELIIAFRIAVEKQAISIRSASRNRSNAFPGPG